MFMPSKRALVRVTPPLSEPFTLAEAKLYLRVDGNEEDALITDLITAAREAAEEYLRRSLMTQSWKLSFDDYTPDEVMLPRGPVQSVTSVKQLELYGASTQIEPAQYYLTPAADMLTFDATAYAHRIEIQYSCGYDDATDIPKPLKYGMLAHMAAIYEQRGDGDAAMPRQAIALYAPFREARL
jgi:uncharacterized phiE125 gp8 family phage protein